MTDAKAIRKCPIPFIHRGSGFCGWCGEAVEGTAWHPACREDYSLHVNRDKQYAFLVARDGEKCACGHGCEGPFDVDHDIELWKIQHMPAIARVWYFGPENLKLRAKRCHAIKSGRGRSEEAHYDALADRRENGKKPSNSRLQSRGFPKGQRPFPKVASKLHSRGFWKPKK